MTGKAAGLRSEEKDQSEDNPETRKRYRFLTIEQVAEELNVGLPLVRTLLKTGELRGIQIGGRGMWRIATKDLEDYIDQAYRVTAERIAAGEVLDQEPGEAPVGLGPMFGN